MILNGEETLLDQWTSRYSQDTIVRTTIARFVYNPGLSTQHYIKDPFKHAHSGIHNDNNLDPRHRLTTLDTLSHHDHINNDLATTTTTLIRPRQIRRHSTIHTIPRSSP